MNPVTEDSSATTVSPAQVAEEAVRWARPLTEKLGDGFLALYLYGSALEPGFDPRRSDVNLLLVAESLPASQVRALGEVWPGGGPVGAPANLVAMTAEQLERAEDTFALELAEVRRRGRLLAGRDLLADLEVHREALRHHLERELRVLNVRLRRVYLEGRDRPGALVAAMAEGIGTVVACARGLGYLQRGEAAPTAIGALEEAAAWAEIEARPWLEAWRIRHDPAPPESADSLFLDFLDAVGRFMRRVDTFFEE